MIVPDHYELHIGLKIELTSNFEAGEEPLLRIFVSDEAS